MLAEVGRCYHIAHRSRSSRLRYISAISGRTDQSPTIAVHLVHVLRGYAQDAALLDHFWVLTADALHHFQVLHGDLV